MRTIFVSPEFPLNRRMRKAVRRGKLRVVREGGERLSLGGGMAVEARRAVRTVSSPLVCMADNGAEVGGKLGGGENKEATVHQSSWLLFLDESGHDHRQMPYEVRGGFALPADKLWSFVQNFRREEEQAYGTRLSEFKAEAEAKGSRLLRKNRFKWAEQAGRMDDEKRRKLVRAFLQKGSDKMPQSRGEFTAYGQASLKMARGIYNVLSLHGAKIFAAAIPRGARPSETDADEKGRAKECLRKDIVFLLERYFYFLEERREHGLLVLDETDKALDRRFVRRLENYFAKTETGRRRASRVAPVPFFVSSELSEPIQAADLVIYCVNWGFRLPARGMNAPQRRDIAENFKARIRRLQYEGTGVDPRTGGAFRTYGIVHVPDPYAPRR